MIKQNDKEQEKQELKLKKIQMAYQKLFEGMNGKIILKDLTTRCHMDKPSYVANSDETIFNEGKRAVFLHIITMAKIDVQKLKEVRNAEY